MQRTILVMAILGSPACLPSSKDGDDSSSEPIPAEPGVEASVELGEGTVRLLTPSPDGVVAVRDAEAPAVAADVLAWSSDLQPQWATPFPGSSIADLDAWDEGGYLLAGSSIAAKTRVATAWRLSAVGAVELVQTYEQQAPVPSSIAVAERQAGQVFLAIDYGTELASFIHASLDLVPTASPLADPQDDLPGGHALTPGGAVIMEATSDGNSYFIEVMGNAVLGYDLPGIPTFVGSGSGLRLVSFGFDRITLSGYATDPMLVTGVDVEIPDLQREGLLMARGSRVVVVDGANAGDVRVTEIDDAGVVVRQLSIEPLQWSDSVATAVAVGHDDAIYVAVRESEPGGSHTSVLHRIAPL